MLILRKLKYVFAGIVAGFIVLNLYCIAVASTIVINEIEGFNDTTPVVPVGGNTGVTIGEQRSIVFRAAADWWASKLSSAVTIEVDAMFTDLSCTSISGTLGAAGPNSFHRNFSNVPKRDTWYVQALANAIAGVDLTRMTDITAQFNSRLGFSGCLETLSWYYGLDHKATDTQIDFYQVVLHELGHGLGFLTLIDETGSKVLSSNDAFMAYLENHSSGKTYPEMTDSERAGANIASDELHWIGDSVKAESTVLSSGTVGDHVQMYAPDPYETGSSVSHWSDSLSPDELMEPVYASPDPITSLTLAAFRDMGWVVTSGGTNDYDYTIYLPHITGGHSDWIDKLQVDNLSESPAEYLVTIYGSDGEIIYQAVHQVEGFDKMILEMKLLTDDGQCGRIDFENPKLFFRYSQQNINGGGVAEFHLPDAISSSSIFFFNNSIPSIAWKGLALSNFSDTVAVVELSLIGNGETVGTVSLTIESHQKVQGLFTQWFPEAELSDGQAIKATTANPCLGGVAISGNLENSVLVFFPGEAQ